MGKALDNDLKQLQNRAFDRPEWAAPTLRRYHSAIGKIAPLRAQTLTPLYEWMFVPPSLWPFNIQDVLDDFLTTLAKGKSLNSRQRLLIELLPPAPNKTICAAVAEHELQVQVGDYAGLVKTQAKYAQNELAVCTHPELRRQWTQIKKVFNISAYCDYKGVIRRSMSVERNLRPTFSINLRRKDEVFQATFDAFCQHWNLYGMQHDQPLPLKLAVNVTPYGTMIHIPAYWSFDPKRDINWKVIAKLHRVRGFGRQGPALAEGKAERLQKARHLAALDQEVKRLGLKGEKKHAFLCAGLGWDVRTSPKRIQRLRTEFAHCR